MGNKEGKFTTYDYFNEEEKKFEKDKEEDWKEKIKQITSSQEAKIKNLGSQEAIIRSSTIFFLPLQAFPWGYEYGDTRGLKHVLVIFECMKDNSHRFYLSIEKDMKGITVQYSEEDNTIKENKRGEMRIGYEKMTKADRGDYSFTSPINELIGLKCPKVMTIFERWKTVPDYNIITGNCQKLVEDILKIFREISNENDMKLVFPGSNEKVQLSVENKTEKERIINLYEGYMIKNKEVKKSPRNLVPKDYSNHVASEEDRQRLQKNEIKEKIDVLINKCFGDKDIYFNHLNKNKMEMKLKDVEKAEEKLTNAKINEIATFWNTEIDGVIISENYGVIIIDIADDDDNDEKVKQRREGAEKLIKKLINIVSEKEEDIEKKTNITIRIVNKKPESSCRIVKENCIQIEKSRVSEDISEEFHNLLEKVLKNSEKPIFTFKHEKQRKFLAALLLIFQNMEKVDDMLFKCITNQNWDTGCNYIVWSREQKEIINAIKLAFKEDPREKSKDTMKPLSELIVGCPGSGKTLILLYACRKYCKKWPDANVLFIVQKQYTALRQHIETCLEDLMDRVIIEDDMRSVDLEGENIGLIIFDERYTTEMIRYTEADINIASNAGIHILSASMDYRKTYRDGRVIDDVFRRSHMLGRANYRSNKAILQLVCKVQSYQRSDHRETVQVDDSTFMEIPMGYSRFNAPVHLKYMTKDGNLRNLNTGEISIEGDTSFERTGFINECVKYIIDQIKNKCLLTKGEVLIYNICHLNILQRIKEKIKNKSLIENGEITEEEYNSLVFLDSRASQGAQYASSIGIFDHASTPYLPQSAMITALTRTIFSAHLLINIAKHPPYRLPLQSQHKTQCIEFDNKDGTSQLGKILDKIRGGREKITVLFLDPSAIDQIDDEAYDKTTLDDGTYNQIYCGDVDVIIGSSFLYPLFDHSCRPIQSRDVTFVVTYDDEKTRKITSWIGIIDYEDKNRIIEDLLIKEFNQIDLFV